MISSAAAKRDAFLRQEFFPYSFGNRVVFGYALDFQPEARLHTVGRYRIENPLQTGLAEFSVIRLPLSERIPIPPSVNAEYLAASIRSCIDKRQQLFLRRHSPQAVHIIVEADRRQYIRRPARAAVIPQPLPNCIFHAAVYCTENGRNRCIGLSRLQNLSPAVVSIPCTVHLDIKAAALIRAKLHVPVSACKDLKEPRFS